MSTSTGAIQLWQQDKEQWTREEGLANIAVSEFVELPEMKVIQSHGGEDESFASRVVRQVLDAKVVFLPPMVACITINIYLIWKGLPSIPNELHQAFRNWLLRVRIHTRIRIFAVRKRDCHSFP